MKSLDEYTKEDWLTHNTFDVSSDAILHRVFRVDYLQSDLDSGVNTLINPCYETQGDPLENPLKSANFQFEGGRHKLFERLMSEYYTQSWSLSWPAWGKFGGGHDTVRVSCRARDLFGRLYDDSDRFASLFYHMARVSYLAPDTIVSRIGTSEPTSFLDSRGFALLHTIVTIRHDFVDEDEVRLVYVRSPRADYSHPLQHTLDGSKRERCLHKFDWTNILTDAVLSPLNRDAAAGERILTTIQSLNTTE